MKWYWVTLILLVVLAAIAFVARYFLEAAALTASSNLVNTLRRTKKIQDEHQAALQKIDATAEHEQAIRESADLHISTVTAAPDVTGWDDVAKRGAP